jgi:hypothetical protein
MSHAQLTALHAKRDAGEPLEPWETKLLGMKERLTTPRDIKAKTRRNNPGSYTTKAGLIYGRDHLRWGTPIMSEMSQAYQDNSGKWQRRSQDVVMGADWGWYLGGQLVLVQCAGRNEWWRHFDRFESWGGSEKLERLGAVFLYWVFDRGRVEPVEMEQWQ